MSRDDIDVGKLQLDPAIAGAPSAMRGPGLKSRLKRALSFNATQTLKEEDLDVDGSDAESIKASKVNGKLKAAPPAAPSSVSAPPMAPSSSAPAAVANGDAESTATPTIPKKKSRAASLFNSRMNMSTDNISLSSTVSSASVMIRKLGAMGKLARRNSLAGITSLFKDKDKEKEKTKDGKDKDKEKEKDGKKKKAVGAKGDVSEASVSHVTAELDRMGSDWNVAELTGLSPAAKLARQHTLKSNAEAAAKAKAEKEREKELQQAAKVNGDDPSNVPAWDQSTTTRQGALSPSSSKGTVRVNEDGTRTLVEDDEDESEDGHYSHQPHHDGWDDDEDWEGELEVDEEEATVRQPAAGFAQSPRPSFGTEEVEMDPWATDVRRSVERLRVPKKGILKSESIFFLRAGADTAFQMRTRMIKQSSSPTFQDLFVLGPIRIILLPLKGSLVLWLVFLPLIRTISTVSTAETRTLHIIAIQALDLLAHGKVCPICCPRCHSIPSR